MRTCVLVSLTLLAFVLPISAQGKKEKSATQANSRVILKSLQTEVRSDNYVNSMKMSDLLEMARAELERAGREVTIVIDEEAFREERGESVDLLGADIRLRNLPAKSTLQDVLRQAIKQLPIKSAFVIRNGKVEIVPYSRTAKEYMLNQTFHVDLSDRRLDAALEELSELTGVSIVIDARAKQKAQTAVTARFHDDVALQDAVRMLTDMAELKVVYLVTGLYITTPEHAQVMQKELKQIYDGPTPALMPLTPGVEVGPPPDPQSSPLASPLAPPLPPSRIRRDGAAA